MNGTGETHRERFAAEPGAEGDDGRLLLEPWRPTADWVRVHVRRLRERDIPVEILRSGDRQRGAVLLKVAAGDGRWRLLDQMTPIDGRARWVAAHAEASLEEASVTRLIAASLARDPDLWVLAIEAKPSIMGRRSP